MANNLVEIIYEQFLGIVEKLAPKYCFEFNPCDFQYKTRDGVNVQLIDILFRAPGKCDSYRDVIVTIDYTSICLNDLPTKKWKTYLKNLANQFLHEIVYVETFVIPKPEKLRKCRKEPKWCHFPTKLTTIIHKPCEPKEEKPKIKVVIEKECVCVPVCHDSPVAPKKKIIIKCDNEPKKPKCNSCNPHHDDDHHESHHDSRPSYSKPGQKSNCGCGY